MRRYAVMHPQKIEKGVAYIEDGYSDYSCDGCGKMFKKPILATVSGEGNVQTYYACPYCLTRIDEPNTPKIKENMEVATKVSRKLDAPSENDAKCQHYFGYLKKRPKNTPIPDECLTCDRMIECLTH